MTSTAAYTPAPLEEVLITHELERRPCPSARLREENEELARLARCLARDPESILDQLTLAAVRLTGAGSAGISMLADRDAEHFDWVSMAGAYAAFVGGRMPRDDSPCGVTIDRGTAQLFRHPGRRFAAIAGADPVLAEGLVLPFRVEGEDLGTIWIASHDGPAFTREDVRVMETIATFCASAFATQRHLRALRAAAATLESQVVERTQQLARTNEMLRETIAVRQRAEEEVRAAHAELEVRVARRTDELRRSNHDLEQFALIASHDLREPLRMVSSFVGLIERRNPNLDEPTRAFLGLAKDGAQRMTRMVNQLLAYAKLSSREPTCVDLEGDDALEDALANLSARIAESGAEIARDRLPRVRADRAQLGQVFQNLVANAIEYCRGRPPRIRITAERDGDRWRIDVSDNGIGLDPVHHERIFAMFQRIDVDAAGRDGAGIGLAACKRIVERLGGRIWVESSSPRGTTFRFTLPAAGGADVSVA